MKNIKKNMLKTTPLEGIKTTPLEGIKTTPLEGIKTATLEGIKTTHTLVRYKSNHPIDMKVSHYL